MGIVYKVKPDIIKFILEQKKKNLSLSCRVLVKIVKDRFSLFLSKSAVNKIIKDAGLSSPVGRKRKYLSKPKVSSVESKIKILPAKKEIFLPKEEQPPKLLEEKEQKQPVIELPVKSEIIKEEPREKIEAKIEHIEIKEDKIFDNMGSFFLKAMELELADAPILARMLDKDIRGEFFKELGFIDNILLYLPCFGIEDFSAISSYNGEGLWLLAQQKKIPFDSIFKYLKQLESIKGRSLTIHSKSTQVFQEVNFLKLFLEDDTVFYIDSQFKSVWTEPNTLSSFSSTYHKTISYINNLFLKNAQPIVLFTAAGYSSFSKIVSEFILACEAIPDKRIVKIELYGAQKKEIDKFLDVPSSFKRYFILGFWPWQREFIELIKQENRPIDSCYIEDINRDIYYNEGQMELVQHLVDKKIVLRFALLKDSPVSPARMGIITNIPLENKPMGEIVQLYLRRWPNMEEAYQDFLKRTQKSTSFDSKEAPSKENPPLESVHTLSGSAATIREDLNYILKQLNKYAQRYFFPPEYEDVDFSTMKQRFYSLPARLKRSKDRLLITLLVPEGYEFYKDLVYAIKRLNESDIRNNLQAKIYFALSKK